jgi:hypothetical protein
MINNIQGRSRSSRKTIGFVLSLALGFGLTATVSVPANAAPSRSSEKVTICHRTSAVTNPYRMITVSVNSIVSNNGHHNNVHNHEANGADPETNGPGVFNPATQYAPSQKKWEDIIPPFYYNVTQGQTVTRTYFEGRNWTTAGKDIYYGIGNKAGLCGNSGAKEFAQNEYAEWLADFPGQNNGGQPNNGQITSKKRDIINDLKDQGNIADGSLSSFDSDFDALPASPRKPKGPNRPNNFSNLITQVENYNSNPNKPVNQAINQALAGVVWKDLNSNGIQDAGEEVFGNLAIQIIDPDSGLPLTSSQLAGLTQLASSVSLSQPLFSFAGLAMNQTLFSTSSNVVTLTTDVNGYFEVPSLPEGDWQVNVITPDGWSYTYDSAGSNDGLMPGTYVPAGGVGFAWAGLVFVGTNQSTPGSNSGTPGSSSGSTPSGSSSASPGSSTSAGTTSALPATGSDLSWMFEAFALLVAFGGALVVIGRGRIEDQVYGTKDY